MHGRRDVKDINRFELLEIVEGAGSGGLSIVHWDTPSVRVLGEPGVPYELVKDDVRSAVRADDVVTGRYGEVELRRGGRCLARHEFSPGGRRVLVHFNSQCLGDTLAWMPAVAAFSDRCRPGELIVSTFYHDLFDYPAFRLIDAEGHLLRDIYAYFEIGYDKQSLEHRRRPIQAAATDRLGTGPVDALPSLRISGRTAPPAPGPYVCIAPGSPKPAARWRYPGGWNSVAAHLSRIGYTPVNISAEEDAAVEGCVNLPGLRPLQERVAVLRGAAFFVGLSGGLAWLAWAAGRPVVMVSGFTQPFNEFECRRVINTDVCHGCWNEVCSKSPCPRHEGTGRQWECSRRIWAPFWFCREAEGKGLFPGTRVVRIPDVGVAGTVGKGD